MNKTIDLDKLQQAAKLIIEAVGDDVNREGLTKTPERFAKALNEMLEGMQYSNDEIVSMFDVCFEDVKSSELVTEMAIPVFSFCEHHIALMYDLYVHVGYIPNGKVIGLSKIARISEMCAKRLQLQERIGTDILDVLKKVLNTEDVAVVIEGKHSCMTARGIKKPDVITRTSALSGRFYNESDLRKEFYDLIPWKNK